MDLPKPRDFVILVLLFLFAVASALALSGCECGAQKAKRTWKTTPEHVIQCYQGGNSIATYCFDRLVDSSDGRQKCMLAEGGWFWLPHNSACVMHAKMCKQEVTRSKPRTAKERNLP